MRFEMKFSRQYMGIKRPGQEVNISILKGVFYNGGDSNN